MPSHSDSTLSWIGLSSVPGVGRITFRKLVRHFGSPERVLAASSEELKNIGGLSDKVISALREHPWQRHAEAETERAARSSVSIVTFDDPRFPASLKNMKDPPLLLYVRGALPPDDATAVALVGTRTPTHYGKTVARRIAAELAAAGVSIVSGLARGIDTEAHRGALEARGRTIGVLACGIDVAYPPENRDLIEEICGTGAVITENPFGTKPESGYFPARNRIISGLSAGTVIIEATEDSGSLITAEYTLEQGRKLFAVPGSIGSPVSKGPHALIRRGAVLAEGAGDILQTLRLTPPAAAATDGRTPELTTDEAALYGLVTSEPQHIDALAAASGMAPGKTSGVLMNLELKGAVQQLPGKWFVRGTA